MRRLTVTPITLLLVACSSAEERQQRQVVQQIEQRVQLPANAEKLEKYARYYAMDGSRIVGTYITLVDPQNETYDLPVGQHRWIEDHRNLPVISDGGCMVVHVRYDPATQKVEQAFCNELA
jgi:hypothetical protein